MRLRTTILFSLFSLHLCFAQNSLFRDSTAIRHQTLTLDSTQLRPALTDDPMQLLQGMVAGWWVVRPGGDPNQNYHTQMMGYRSGLKNNSPMIWVDGSPVYDLSAVRQEEIASIRLLQSPAETAPYGIMAHNGVILITTKRPNTDRVRLTYATGVQWGTPARTFDVANAAEYAGFSNYQYDSTGNYDTDWMSYLHRNTLSHTHWLQYSQGKRGHSWSVSGGYQGREGVFSNSGYQRLNGHANYTYSPKNGRWSVSLGARGARKTLDQGFTYALQSAYHWPSNMPVKSDVPSQSIQGYSYTNNPVITGTFLYNPVAFNALNFNLGEQTNWLGFARGSVNLTSKLKGFASLTQHELRNIAAMVESYPQLGTNLATSVGSAYRTKTKRYGDIGLTYAAQKGHSQWQLEAGYRYFLDKIKHAAQSGGTTKEIGIPNSVKDIENLGIDAQLQVYQRFQITAREYTHFLYSTVHYTYRKRIKINANIASASPLSAILFGIRTDFTIATSNRFTWDLFGSFGKSLGRRGNAGPQEDLVIAALTPSGTLIYPKDQVEATRGGELGTYFATKRFNTDIRWSRNQTASYYIAQHWHTLHNYGLSFNVSLNIINHAKSKWVVGANYTTVSTKYGKVVKGLNGLRYNPSDKQGIGVTPVWGWQTAFEYEADGFLYADYTQESGKAFGTLTGKATDPTGVISESFPTLPKHNTGIHSLLKINNWRLFALVRGAHGHHLLNEARYYSTIPGNTVLNKQVAYLNEARKDFKWLERADFWRLDQIQLAYNFPNKKLSHLEIAIGAQQPFTWTKYTGVEPEIRLSDSKFNNQFEAMLFARNPRPWPGVDRISTYTPERSVYIKLTTVF